MNDAKRDLLSAILYYEELVRRDGSKEDQDAAWSAIEPLRQPAWEASEEWKRINEESRGE